MFQHATRTLLAAACLSAAAGTAHAAFTWSPAALGLAGAGFTADGLVLGDHARIRFSGDGTTFTDTGYLPILGFTRMGRALAPRGFGAADGTGWGAYIAYSASGTQSWLAPGIPGAATFTRLDYEIVGYNGRAAFLFDADGAPAVGGAPSRVTTLGTGALVSGGLAFEWASPEGPTITGRALTTVSGLPGSFSGNGLAGFEVHFLHPPGDYAFTSPDTVRISDTVGHSTATAWAWTEGHAPALAPAVAEMPVTGVPEPGTALLVGGGLLCLRALRRRVRR